MSYWWTGFVADIADWFPGGLLAMALVLLLLAAVVGLLLQPRGLFGFKRRRKTKPDKPSVEPVIVTDTTAEAQLPELPSDRLLARAQGHMATGDYRNAVREWLRVMVRDLVEREVIEHRPGWTVTELAAAAGLALPMAGVALSESAQIFSDVWYGGREADLPLAARMRDLHAQVAAIAVGHDRTAAYPVEAP